jgi:hypothetical protein
MPVLSGLPAHRWERDAQTKKELEERNARIEHLRLVIREDERVLLEEGLLGLSTDRTEKRLRLSRDLLRLEL